MLKSLDDIDLAGKRVLIRADFNVPLADGRVADDTRIREAAATIREVLAAGGRPVVMSHLGRPKGQPRPDLSLKVVVPDLSRLLGDVPVTFARDCVGDAAREAVAAGRDGVVLLENLRFHPGEEGNDANFAVELALSGDCYVNDAFSSAHRAHASVVGVPERLPAVAGRLLQHEVESLEAAFAQPARPALALVGGAKVDDKLKAIAHFSQRFDAVAVAGGVANTFLRADGRDVGGSLVAPDLLATAQEIRDHARAQGCELILPEDVVVADEIAPDAASRTVPVAEVGPSDRIVDLGPRSVARIVEELGKATVGAWAGPLGAADKGFPEATEAVAREIVRLGRESGLRSVAGGGETMAALRAAGVADGFGYLSLGGGAFLKWLGGERLPGLQPLLTSPPAA